MLPVTRIAPSCASIMAGSTFWIAQNTLVRLTRIVSSNTAGSKAIAGVKPPVSPALANRHSNGTETCHSAV